MIVGYNLGAYDYITKPFDSEILVLKIKKLLEASEDTHKINIHFSNVTFNVIERVLKLRNKTIKVSPRESDLLCFLLKNKNKVVQRDTILLNVWKDDGYNNINTMDVYISRLRKYLKEVPNVLLENIHSTGFILKIYGN
jgi:two-component system OmpR family response regulator